jgi:hypothetical protein
MRIQSLFLIFCLFSQALAQESPPVSKPIEEEKVESPEQIQQELNTAEAQFKTAQEMFNPWYAGPLLTGSASMVPPEMLNVQPYIFLTDNYAAYNTHRHAVDTPNAWSLNPKILFQSGVTSWFDLTFLVQETTNWKQGQNTTGIGDITLYGGFCLMKQGLWNPGIKLYINETFPTGPYQRLNPAKNGTDAIGGGSYVTSFGLNFAKIVFWSKLHPASLRLSLNYNVPSTVRVHGLNTYGGGSGTNGKVRPGNSFSASLGTEYSFTQKWVLANDVVYVCANQTRFSGNPGVTPTGAPATNTSSSNDQLSLAPALEYNPTPNLGILAGMWFSVYGRNSADFLSGVFSVTYLFPLNPAKKG